MIQSIVNVLTITGAVIIVFSAMKKTKNIIGNIRESKKRRRRQKLRLRSCRNGYTPASVPVK